MALSPLLSIATHIAIPSSAMASSILCKPFSFTVRQMSCSHDMSTAGVNPVRDEPGLKRNFLKESQEEGGRRKSENHSDYIVYTTSGNLTQEA